MHVPDPIVTRVDDDPAEHALLADSVGIALLVVLDTLSPAERLAFVLHDVFAVPFEQIGPILDRSPAAAKQLASRARHRLRDAPAHAPRAERGRCRPGGAAGRPAWRRQAAPTSPGSGPSSMPSSPRRGRAISRGCSPSSTRTSSCGPTRAPARSAPRSWSAAPAK